MIRAVGTKGPEVTSVLVLEKASSAPYEFLRLRYKHVEHRASTTYPRPIVDGRSCLTGLIVFVRLIFLVDVGVGCDKPVPGGDAGLVVDLHVEPWSLDLRSL